MLFVFTNARAIRCLLVITAIGLSLGLWKDAHAHPFFRHTAPTESRAVEGAQDDDGERKEAGKVVSETAGQAHTEDEPEAGGRKEAEHSLAELRRKARNTLINSLPQRSLRSLASGIGAACWSE